MSFIFDITTEQTRALLAQHVPHWNNSNFEVDVTVNQFNSYITYLSDMSFPDVKTARAILAAASCFEDQTTIDQVVEFLEFTSTNHCDSMFTPEFTAIRNRENKFRRECAKPCDDTTRPDYNDPIYQLTEITVDNMHAIASNWGKQSSDPNMILTSTRNKMIQDPNRFQYCINNMIKLYNQLIPETFKDNLAVAGGSVVSNLLEINDSHDIDMFMITKDDPVSILHQYIQYLKNSFKIVCSSRSNNCVTVYLAKPEGKIQSQKDLDTILLLPGQDISSNLDRRSQLALKASELQDQLDTLLSRPISNDSSYMNSYFQNRTHLLNQLTAVQKELSELSSSSSSDIDYNQREHLIKDVIKVQIILRQYCSLSQVLVGFDLDASCLGYYNGKLYCTSRGLHALTYRSNTVDLLRASTTYENRLIKYAQVKGFGVVVPNLKYFNSLIPYMKNVYSLKYLKGLIKLIAAEDVKPDKSIVMSDYDASGFDPFLFLNDNKIKYQKHWFIARNIDDVVFNTKCIDACNTNQIENNKAKEVKNSWGYSSSSKIYLCKVDPTLSFITKNPGQQGNLFTGSFQPINITWIQWASAK